jgi:hypothetical protein
MKPSISIRYSITCSGDVLKSCHKTSSHNLLSLLTWKIDMSRENELTLVNFNNNWSTHGEDDVIGQSSIPGQLVCDLCRREYCYGTECLSPHSQTCQWIQFRTISIQPRSYYNISMTSMLTRTIFLSLGVTSGLFRWVPTKILYSFLFYFVHATYLSFWYAIGSA